MNYRVSGLLLLIAGITGMRCHTWGRPPVDNPSVMAAHSVLSGECFCIVRVLVGRGLRHTPAHFSQTNVLRFCWELC